MASEPVARPSNKFAHWNTFPFMTTPRTKYYSAQLQSPIFRLPREVRDIVYEYYLTEKEGYHFDSETGKLLYQNPSSEPKQVVRLGLRITCRIAAEEMKDRAFEKVNFYPKRSVDDGGEYMGLRSRAGRFRCILKYIERQKCRMLVCAAELLQPEDYVDLYDRYPSAQHLLQAPLRRAIAQQTDDLGASEEAGEDILSQSFSDALHYALMLAKERHPSRFAKLVGATFGLGECPVRRTIGGVMQNNLFVNGALSDIYHWHPVPWCMPDDQELSTLEALICQPGESDVLLPVTDDGIFYFRDIREHSHAELLRWYFSAAAVAVDFLHRTPKERRYNIRTIVLNEDVKSVSRPESHARGLIPYCLENPRLRIERHIGLLTNLLPVGSSQSPANRSAHIRSSDCFKAILPWIEEALLLHSYGMPLKSFQLVLDGVARESSEFWSMLKFAAATQEARGMQLQLSGIDLPQRNLRPSYSYCSAIWSLPTNFAQTIRHIAEGNSLVRYNGDVGEIWDHDTFCYERREWTEAQWGLDWHEKIGVNIISKFWLYVWESWRIGLEDSS